MAAYFYRIIKSFDKELPNPYVCAHDWVRESDPALDAYCNKCQHYGTLSEDTRNRPKEWWDELLARAHEGREVINLE